MYLRAWLWGMEEDNLYVAKAGLERQGGLCSSFLREGYRDGPGRDQVQERQAQV